MRKAVVLDLAGIAMDGHARIHDALKSALSRHNVLLTPALFGGCFLDQDVAVGAQRLLAAMPVKGATLENLAPELETAVGRSLAETAKAPAALRKCVAAWVRGGAQVGLVSTLDRQAAAKALTRLQLTDTPLPILGFSRRKGYVACAAAWLGISRNLRIPPCYIVAVVASAASHRGALFAGMNTVVVAGEHTAGQDFTGAGAVVSGIEELDAAVTHSLGCLR
jgi:beta-phosphoglucomutase-like phosphatase (HAD superfamily)